jgi:hypothetical protein
MNLIWHIVKKDLRRFWLLIALLALALFSKAELLTVAPNFGEPVHNVGQPGTHPPAPVALNSTDAMRLIYEINLGSHLRTNLLWVVCCSDFILLVVLVLGVLLEDPTQGDRTFWRTRPIAGWHILAAKAVFIFLVSWPLQAAMQVMINFAEGAPIAHWYSAIGSLTGIQAWWISVLVLAALLWRNPIVGLGSLFGCYCLLEVLAFILDEFGYNPYPSMDKHAAAAGFVWFGITLLVSWFMYCHRQRRTGSLIFATGMTVIALIMFF